MGICTQLAENALTPAASLPRTHETLDFSKLFSSSDSEFESKFELPSVSLSGSEANGSVNSQILYMKRSKRTRQSALSSMSNSSGHVSDGSLNGEATLNLVEEITWNIVNQEIFGWQYACHTGRPYWWSLESKSARLGALQPRLSRRPNPRPRMRDTIDERWKPCYCRQRRAVSEGFANDPSTSNDLARLVAIQLLGSCFTLPPNNIAGAPVPNYSLFNESGVNLPGPRMISSLRMHSHFRYSPSCGHQAQSASPVPVWLGAFDGPSPISSSPTTDFGSQPTQDGISGLTQIQRRKIRRREIARHVNDRNLLDGCSEGGSRFERDFTCAAIGSFEISHEHALPPSHDSIGRSHPSSRVLGLHSLKVERSTSVDDESAFSDLYEALQVEKPKSDYSLGPVIGSEPHHVFIQPVKGMMVKRWRTFRRRLGGSLYGYSRSEEESGPSYSAYSSAGVSTEGRTRRRRARQESEIDGSVDRVAHLNSPASGRITPPTAEPEAPYWVDSSNPTPQFQLADPLVAAAELVATQCGATSHQSSHLQDSVETLGSSPQSGSGGTIELQTDPHAGIVTTEDISQDSESQTLTPFKQHSSLTAYSYSTRRSQVRRRRKSMLSEVCTPDDFNHITEEGEGGERSIVSPGSTLESPAEDIEPLSPTHLRG